MSLNNTDTIVGSGQKLVTFSSLDMKLRRLLVWYLQHKDEVLQEHQLYLNSHCRLFDIINKNNLKLIHSSTMKHSEKNALLKGLLKANMTWRKYNNLVENKQQPITKFFKPKKV